ncbi:MAG: glycosyltransferase, partial [Eggerthellaceae bacterium]|nr:glycosyltransferase [Eggerthellaceae bacterium]
LRDIEILVINDGSTDASGDIAHEYASRDERIRVIDKENSGYGASMNLGIAQARGEYVGILEPDDWADMVLFAKLYAAASHAGCDIAKCNYYRHVNGRDVADWNLHGIGYNRPFDPVQKPQVVCTEPAIWTGLYRREWLIDQGIAFRETPGAAFQDAGFSLKAWFAASRVVLLRRPMMHYRMDNPDSSSKSSDKVFTVCDEVADALEFLRNVHPDCYDAFVPWVNVDKWGKYRWNYERIDASLHGDFAARMYEECRAAQEADELDLSLFDATSRVQLLQLLEGGPEAFAARYPQVFPWVAGEASQNSGAQQDSSDQQVVHVQVEGDTAGTPGVSVIVPVYNCAPYVAECLESLKSQTYANFEAIVVDDASIDGSLAVVRACVAHDARFTVLPQAVNRGLSAVRNVGLDQACGEYVVFLDSDDYLVPDALETLVRRAREQQLDDLYFSAASFVDGDSSSYVEDFAHRPDFDDVTTGKALFTYFVERDQFHTQAALRMIRRAFLEENNIRFMEGILHEDILFTFQTLVASNRTSFLNEPLYMRRLRDDSIMGRTHTMANVHGHFVSMQLIKRWLIVHADEYDGEFLEAVGKQLAFWREVCAYDIANDIDPQECAAYISELSAADKVDFFCDIIGSGTSAKRARDEYESSRTYKLGKAIVAGPKFVVGKVDSLRSRFGDRR